MKLYFFTIVCILVIFFGNIIQAQTSFAQEQIIDNQVAIQKTKDTDKNVLYNGTVYHIITR